MNDTLRELTSYGSFTVPLLKVKKIISPEKVRWGDKSQYFLYYKAVTPRKTLVVYIHGGGWNSGSPTDFHFIGQSFALAGYDCVMPGYRKTPKYRYEDIAEDIFLGWCKIADFLNESGERYSDVAIVGSSAGAHLGALLCFDRELQVKYGVFPDSFSSFISLAGPLCFDFKQTWILNSLLKDLFGSRKPEDWKRGEPLSKLTEPQKTRVLLIQSRHDGLLGFEQAEKYRDKACMLGLDCILRDVEEKQNTHSAYSAGIFLKNRDQSPTLASVFDFLE